MGLLFQGEQVAREGGNPRRRTTFEAARSERKRGRDTGSTRGSREPGVLSEPLLAKRFAAHSETSSSSSSSSGVAMCCKSPEQARLYLPSLPSVRHRSGAERRADQLLPLKPGAPLWCGFLFPVFPVKQSKIKPSCLDLIQKMYQTKSVLSRNVLVSISAEVYCFFFSGKQPCSHCFNVRGEL